MAEERETERIWATISRERYDQLREWADELGIQFSQYIALVAWMGASQLRRTLHPEQYIPASVMADAIAKATAQSFTPDIMVQAMAHAISAIVDKMPPEDLSQSGVTNALEEVMREQRQEDLVERVRKMQEKYKEDMNRIDQEFSKNLGAVSDSEDG